MVAFLLLKVRLILLFPVIGIAVGLAFLVAKIVFIVVMVCIAIWLFRRLGRAQEKPA